MYANLTPKEQAAAVCRLVERHGLEGVAPLLDLTNRSWEKFLRANAELRILARNPKSTHVPPNAELLNRFEEIKARRIVYQLAHDLAQNVVNGEVAGGGDGQSRVAPNKSNKGNLKLVKDKEYVTLQTAA